MKLVGKFAVLVLALSLFASPLMACLLPDSTLTDEERECCRHMAGDCGEMPSSHSCCQTIVKDSDPYLSTMRTVVSVVFHFAIAAMPIASQAVFHNSISLRLPYSHAHAPPEPPPDADSILRI